MHRSLVAFTVGLGLCWGTALCAQTPPPPVTETPSACELQVRDIYQTLVREQMLTEDAGATVWPAQLIALSKKLRTLTTQYTVRRQQAESNQMQLEQTIAQLIDQARDLNQRLPQVMTAQGAPPPPVTAQGPKE